MSAVDLEARRTLATQLLEVARGNACPFLNAVGDETRAQLETRFSGVDPHGLSRVELERLAEQHRVTVDFAQLEEALIGEDVALTLAHGQIQDSPRQDAEVRSVHRVDDNAFNANEMNSIFDQRLFPLEEKSP